MLEATDAKSHQLVQMLLTTSSARLALFDIDGSNKDIFLKSVIRDSRIQDHFQRRCAFVSCDGVPTVSAVVGLLAAELGLELRDDFISSILKDLTSHERTLIILHKLDAILLHADPEQQEMTEILLASLVTLDQLTLVATLGGVLLPEGFTWVGSEDRKVPLTQRDSEPFTVSRTPKLNGDDQARALPLENTHHLHSNAPLSNVPRTVFESRLPPARPAVFHGRTKEVELLVANAILPSTCPLGIVGPGGIGKTTLALKVLHDPRVRAHFARERLFLSCEAATTPEDALVQLASKLGVPRSHDTPLWPAVLENLRSRQRVFLIIDNFESIWSPTDDSLREAAEVFLAQLTVLDELTLVVTTRGNQLPDMFMWANPDTAELDTLSSTAARQTFEDLCCLKPEVLSSEPEANALTNLLREVDFMPLAVNLLARLDDLPSRLLREWSEYYTEVLEADDHDGTRRELSVTVSIKISLAHLPAETANVRPRQLLSVLGQLPSGLFPATSDKLRSTIPNIDSAIQDLLRHSLAYKGGLGELRILSPVRHHISARLPMSLDTRTAVNKIYTDLAGDYPQTDRIDVEAPAYDTEIANIIGILTAAIDVLGDDLLQRIITFTIYCTYRRHFCLQLAQQLLSRINGDVSWTATCLLNIGSQLHIAGEMQPAIESMERALNLYIELGELSSEAAVRGLLVECLRKVGRSKDADVHQARSDELDRECPERALTAKPAPGEDPVEAEQRYRDALQERMQAGDARSVTLLCQRILEIVKSRGDKKAYTKELEAVVALGDRVPYQLVWRAAMKFRLANQYLLTENESRAEDLLIDAYALASGCNYIDGVAKITRALGRVRFGQRRIGEAVDHLQAAAKLWREVGDEESAKDIEKELNWLQTNCSGI